MYSTYRYNTRIIEKISNLFIDVILLPIKFLLEYQLLSIVVLCLRWISKCTRYIIKPISPVSGLI